VHASWKQFIVGVLLGIAGWLIWYAGASWIVALLPLVLSCGLVAHAPFIMANGEHEPVPPPPPFRLSAWLLDLAQTLAVGLGVLFVAAYASTVIGRAATSLPAGISLADVARAALCVLWAFAMIATFRKMRTRVAAE
jgi:hypothetical protein